MNIDSIKNGLVIDHIRSGGAMRIYDLLGLGSLDCTVAIIKNAQSGKMGRKDIIKIDTVTDIDLDVLGYVDPGITVNVIRGGELVEKKNLTLPERLENVLRCKNPRCITSVEPGLKQVFFLSDRERKTYRCLYCEAKAER
ncbi:MAG TPA: aspartate carbamoyltransferase regulatory subunit [Candidatus Scatomorpha stercorigallinarum]|nr:aspartate carbamoyltransferase regulatory subunit [Candidatus Scatomorpha stercorigallinarum]